MDFNKIINGLDRLVFVSGPVYDYKFTKYGSGRKQIGVVLYFYPIEGKGIEMPSELELCDGILLRSLDLGGVSWKSIENFQRLSGERKYAIV